MTKTHLEIELDKLSQINQDLLRNYNLINNIESKIIKNNNISTNLQNEIINDIHGIDIYSKFQKYGTLLKKNVNLQLLKLELIEQLENLLLQNKLRLHKYLKKIKNNYEISDDSYLKFIGSKFISHSEKINELFCYCKKQETSNMVFCDNINCFTEKFHKECIDNYNSQK